MRQFNFSSIAEFWYEMWGSTATTLRLIPPICNTSFSNGSAFMNRLLMSAFLPVTLGGGQAQFERASGRFGRNV
jgi:hypothetical protein